MTTQYTENDVLTDPEGAVLAIRRANLGREDAERTVEQFENVFAAFDALRRNGYAPAEYSPQWRARAEKAEAILSGLSAEIPDDEREALAAVVSRTLDAHLPEEHRSIDPTEIDEDVAAAVFAAGFRRQVSSTHEAAWRKAIADQVRRNCTLPSAVLHGGGDQIVYGVCDWIENPPEWSSFGAPTVPARFTTTLVEIEAEAARSIEKHGEQVHLPMGTGPNTYPLATYAHVDAEGLSPWMDAVTLAELANDDTKAHSHNEGGDGTVTWWQILREEVLEAASELDAAALRAELVQVAAVAVKMIDALDTAEGDR